MYFIGDNKSIPAFYKESFKKLRNTCFKKILFLIK